MFPWLCFLTSWYYFIFVVASTIFPYIVEIICACPNSPLSHSVLLGVNFWHNALNFTKLISKHTEYVENNTWSCSCHN